jgi:copper resistance protein D
MVQLLDLYGFLSVILRAMTIVGQTLAVGGVIFALLVARPLRLVGDERAKAVLDSYRPLIMWAAFFLALVQISLLVVTTSALIATADLSIAEVAGAGFFIAGVATIVVSSGLALIVRARVRHLWQWAFALAVAII